MMSLAVEFRPQTFNEVCGQQSIVKILNRQLSTGNISNTYLFAGSSGCGKTTMARIFARELNKYQDITGNWRSSEPIEIDGASNNGVENVKNIIADASERSIEGKYKVFIIDEAHMLTTAAWNAFLKTVEEPPMYTVFIFCTTDPQKIPGTILNRCMRFNFSRIDSQKLRERLEYICKVKGFTNYTSACEYIARISHGQARNAIATLEKCAGYSTDLSMENCMAALGSVSYDLMFTLLNNLIDGNETEVIKDINDVYMSGNDIKPFIDQFLSFVLDVTKYCLMGNITITQFPDTVIEKLKGSINFANAGKYYGYLTNKILEIKNMIKTDSDPLSTVTVKLLGVCRCQ